MGTACCVIINFEVEQSLDFHFFVTIALISTSHLCSIKTNRHAGFPVPKHSF